MWLKTWLVGWLLVLLVDFDNIHVLRILDCEKRKSLAVPVDLSGGGWRGHEEVSSQLT